MPKMSSLKMSFFASVAMIAAALGSGPAAAADKVRIGVC
jgi:hypothetical protein